MLKLVASSLIGLAAAAPAADKVMKMPGFDATSFGVVSRSLASAPVLLERAPLRLLRTAPAACYSAVATRPAQAPRLVPRASTAPLPVCCFVLRSAPS